MDSCSSNCLTSFSYSSLNKLLMLLSPTWLRHIKIWLIDWWFKRYLFLPSQNMGGVINTSLGSCCAPPNVRRLLVTVNGAVMRCSLPPPQENMSLISSSVLLQFTGRFAMSRAGWVVTDIRELLTADESGGGCAVYDCREKHESLWNSLAIRQWDLKKCIKWRIWWWSVVECNSPLWRSKARRPTALSSLSHGKWQRELKAEKRAWKRRSALTSSTSGRSL